MAMAYLKVSATGLELSEHGERADPSHNFTVSCSDVLEVKTNQAKLGPGWFHIRLKSRNYNLARSVSGQVINDKAASKATVDAISSACGRQLQ
jgi:hypothetical protein